MNLKNVLNNNNKINYNINKIRDRINWMPA